MFCLGFSLHIACVRRCRQATANVFIFGILGIWLFSDTHVTAQGPISGRGGNPSHNSLAYTTAAYQKEALRLVLEEANNVARELNLPEKLPITETDLVEHYISPPRMSQQMGTFGNVTTSNYTYYISVDNKFSFLTKRHLEMDYPKLRTQFLWPTNRLNTNAAFQLATQVLGAISVDLTTLNHDCNVRIDAFTPEGKNGKHFVPLYWIVWIPKNSDYLEGAGGGASVEVFEPKKELRQLHVVSSKYILRKSLAVTNLDYLLSQTNRSGTANVRSKP